MALGYIDRAKKKGYIPIIDLYNSSNDCLKDNSVLEKNPWEYYFEQPSLLSSKTYTLDDVYKSYNVVHCNSGLHMVCKRMNKSNIHKRYLISQKIRMIDSRYDYISQLKNSIFDNLKGDIVGAYYRGTDYKSVGEWSPTGHAKVPKIETFCDSLDEYMNKWNCKNLFFMTEEQEALDYVMQRYPRAKYIKKERFSKFSYGESISKQVLPKTSRFENNLLYLGDIYILSKCQYLVGTVNSGLLMAMTWNDNRYKDTAILDYGITR